MFNYKKTRIPHFRRFVLQNFPFIEQDFDALTDYQLICKVVEYLNKVITSQNALISEMERYENEIDGKFNNLVRLFNELKDFVDNYFDNLDVQEEINNKLDQMAESGQLADIIAGYIQLKGILAYDTVADLKNADNIVNGSFVETYGYYEKGDSGGAKYKIRKITNDDTVDESLLIEISSDPENQLVAELMVEDSMNIKQFGVTGDGETDDTTKFNIAIANCKRIEIGDGSYLIEKLLPSENQEIVGIGEAKLKLTGASAPLCNLNSNVKLYNLDIECTKANMEWNRCAIDSKSNIIIDSCKISGFRHNDPLPNAWGILMQSASDVIIRNCYFDNNSQSDIAIVNDCKDIKIDHCNGSAFYINIEPANANTTNDDILISNCKLHQLSLLENAYTGTATQSAMVENCKIDLLKYDGGTVDLIGCEVDDIINENYSGVIFAGILNLNNAMNLSKNLLEDPYIDNWQNATSSSQPWFTSYMSAGLTDSITTIKDNDGIQTLLNPNNVGNITARLQHRDISVIENEKYILRTNSKSYYPETGTNYASLNIVIVWKDETDAQVKREVISLNRGSIGSMTTMSEQSAVLVVPEGATKLSIQPCIATNPTSGVQGTQSFYIRSIELLKFNGGKNPNIIPSLPIREHRTFVSDMIPNYQFNKYYIGDKMYYKTPSTYIGAVATADGYGNNATWKNFGALAS